MVAVLWFLCLTRWCHTQTIHVHNMFSMLLTLKVLADLLFLALLWLCPWTLFAPDYLETLLTSIDTVYRSLFYTIVLLLSFVSINN